MITKKQRPITLNKKKKTKKREITKQEKQINYQLLFLKNYSFCKRFPVPDIGNH